MPNYDPLKLAGETERIVVNGRLRKYYRVGRLSRWYGGIAESHCCGCNLRCVFCWSGFPRDHPDAVGQFYSPKQIFEQTVSATKKRGLRQMRITGNEPTIGKEHLLDVLALVDKTNLTFILETNGILIGHDSSYTEQLSRFHNVHVRVSLKATNAEEFGRLTGAYPDAFNLQLKALENLLSAGVSSHPAIMVSFTTPDNIEKLKQRLREIHPSLAESLEAEQVILYPPVVERLKAAGIPPKPAESASRFRTR